VLYRGDEMSETKQYSSNVYCNNCGFSDRVVNDYGKIFLEINCPNCGTPNLRIHSEFFAKTYAIRDGVVGKMEFVTRDTKGRFVTQNKEETK